MPPSSRLVLACLLAATVASSAPPPVVVRGPYLQRVSGGQAIVRWRTDVATPSVVQYGEEPAELFVTATGAAGTEHRVELSGLTPGRLYHYAVGDGTVVLAGGDGDHFFRTAPAPGGPGPHRIWALGDYGLGDLDAAAVRDGYLAFAAGAAPDVWITLGDNAYYSGSDAQFQAGLFDAYPGLLRRAALWPSLGNHDAGDHGGSDSATGTGPYFDAFSLPRSGQAGGVASGTEAYYSFDHGNVHLVALDSADSDRAADGPMASWLVADLAATDADWVIAYFHHPPYTRGSHDSDQPAEDEMVEMRRQILPLLEAGGVDLVVAGHSHGYERSALIDGHHGSSATFDPLLHVVAGGDGDPAGDGAYRKRAGAHGGAVHVVAGSAAKVAGAGTYGHPALPYTVHELGSLVIDVAGRHLEGRLIGVDGTVLDRFAIADDTLFGDGFESGGLVPGWWPEG